MGHLQQNCENRKRIKCFICEKLGPEQKDCAETIVVRQKDDRWRDSDMVRRIVASRATQSSSGMAVVQAFLEVEDGKMWKVKREIGIKILQVQCLEEALCKVVYNKEVRGIQARGSKVEFWLSQSADMEK